MQTFLVTFGNMSEEKQEKFKQKLEQLKSCPNFNEITFIKNHISIHHHVTAKICDKHRSDFGVNFRQKFMSCKFPSHTAKRSHQASTSTVSYRPIPREITTETETVGNGG